MQEKSVYTFSTSRLLLADLTVSDAGAVYAIYENPEILTSYAERPIPTSDDAAAFISRITAGDNRVWSIRLRRYPGEIIGLCALHHWHKEQGSVEIGGTILPPYWGQAIMREAFEAIIDYAAREMKVKTIIGKTLPGNKQAVRLVEKLGFSMADASGDEVILRKIL